MASLFQTPRSRRRMRRVSLLPACLALLGATCQAEANPPETIAPIEARSEHVEAWDASAPRATASVLALRAALATEGPAAIVARADALAAAPSAERAELLWLAASLDPDPTASLARFTEIAASGSALAPWATIEAARRLRETDPARAVELLEGLSSLGEGWAGRSEALSLGALALLDVGSASSEAREAALRAALEGTTRAAPRPSIARALAELLAEREPEAARREALDLYDQLLVRAGGAERSSIERARAALLQGFPEASRASLAAPSPERELERAELLASSGRHRDAADAYAALAEHLAPGSVERCRALGEGGRVLARARLRELAIERIDRMLAECEPALLRALSDGEPEASLDARRDALAWAHYSSGRALVSMGRAPQALPHFEAVVRLAPSHRLADDALVYEARVRLERGEREDAHRAFERAIALEGDLRGEARFLLAWDLRGAGELEAATAQLDASLAEGTGEAAEGIIGRAAYWRARLLEERAERDPALVATAIDAFEGLAREQPLTFYGRLALARLDAHDATRSARLREATLEARAPLVDALAERDSLVARSASVRALADRLTTPREREAFARGFALLVVGELSRGERELELVGLRGDGDDATVRALASLLADTGHANRATELVRRRLPPMVSGPADVESLSLYRVAYPDAFSGLIEGAAEGVLVDPSFVRAVAREESSFNPEAVSVARAYGLLQIIRPTAERYARSLGLASDPAALRTPSINVQIGVRYMRALARRYSDEVALIPPAYNAGEGNVDRWLRARSELPFDAWVEEIPFAETRGYTRRVIQSWLVYAFLERGALPTLPSRLPSRG